jgi:peptidoglycan hydrolase-like protein with peptidoglycan-binding domain
MKKVLIASGIAVLAFAMVAGAQGYTFNTNLTVGSTGPDVVALQTWLVSKNYLTMPAGVAMGYFGSRTKTSVQAYQASAGLPSTGFVGPLTRGKLNGGGAVVVNPGGTTVVPCPVGYNCTPIGGTVTTTTPTNGTTVSPTAMDGRDGSVTLSSSSYVSTSQTLKKGDVNKPIISATAQATAGSVTVTRFDVHFTLRPWLLFGKLTLKDQAGNILATKALTSAADATEVTVGSDYLVRFDGVNAVVSPTGGNTTFIVTADVLAASDKITGQTVTVSIPSGSIRTLNGKGYTDSLGFASGNTTAVTLSSTGSTGDLYTSIAHTPDTTTTNISTTNVTAGVTLGIFDLKLQNQSGNLNTLVFNVNDNKGSSFAGPTLFQNVGLYDGSTYLGGAYTFSSANPGVVTFVNLNVPLTVDVWKSLTLKADVLATSTAFTASSTFVKASTVGVDNNYNTITLTNASNVTSNDTTFVPNAGITITAITAVKGNVTTPSSGSWLAAYPSITFTINNTGSNAIYISKTAATALATTTSSGAAASTTVSSTVASGSTTGDTSVAYVINANASRTFTYNFTVDNTLGTTASKKISITQVNYGTGGAADGTAAGQDAELNVNYGLTSAFVQVP